MIKDCRFIFQNQNKVIRIKRDINFHIFISLKKSVREKELMKPLIHL